MSALADQVAEYLALRRSLGFALKREELPSGSPSREAGRA